MKSLVILFACVLAVSADVSELFNNLRAPKFQPKPSVTVLQSQHHGHAGAGQHIAITKQAQDVGFDGNYHYVYETENGIHADAQGSLKQLAPEQFAQVAQGSYSYTSPEGEQVQMNYVADENGFQPQGSHIPVPPPIPEAILRALEYIRTHPPKEEPGRRF